MNLSGRAVAALARFFAIAPAEILVVHDELDLEPGEIEAQVRRRQRRPQRSARHRRATRHRRTFWRMRIGIGHPRDSAIPQQEVVDYVLRPAVPPNEKLIRAAIERGLDAWPAIAAGDLRARDALVAHRDRNERRRAVERQIVAASARSCEPVVSCGRPPPALADAPFGPRHCPARAASRGQRSGRIVQ